MTDHVSRFCLCGDSMTITSESARVHRALTAFFDRVHTGDGHGPASADEAKNARRRQARAEAKR